MRRVPEDILALKVLQDCGGSLVRRVTPSKDRRAWTVSLEGMVRRELRARKDLLDFEVSLETPWKAFLAHLVRLVSLERRVRMAGLDNPAFQVRLARRATSVGDARTALPDNVERKVTAEETGLQGRLD